MTEWARMSPQERAQAGSTSSRPSNCPTRSAKTSGAPTRRCPKASARRSRAAPSATHKAGEPGGKPTPEQSSKRNIVANPSLSAAPVEAGGAHRGAGRAGCHDDAGHPPARAARAPAGRDAEDRRHPGLRRPQHPAAPAWRAERRRAHLGIGAGRPRHDRRRAAGRGGRASAEHASPPRLHALRGVLLFGVVMVAGLAYGMLTDQRHALQGNTGLQVFLFIVLGVYFAGLWSSSGQTLAMKTWHIRVQAADGRAPSRTRAARATSPAGSGSCRRWRPHTLPACAAWHSWSHGGCRHGGLCAAGSLARRSPVAARRAVRHLAGRHPAGGGAAGTIAG